MRIKINWAGAKETKFSEYALRFFFGGIVTVATGIVAKKFGAGVGGLFLAFPAIFPATATLIASREKEKKHALGSDGTIRGREAAAIEARSTAYGTLGLIAFALIVWHFLPKQKIGTVLAVAAASWLLVAMLLWRIARYTNFTRGVQHTPE